MKTNFLTSLLFLISFNAFAQTKEELVYPLVPIEDLCHFAFDDTTTLHIVSKSDFQKLDRIWYTKNSCYGFEVDTVFAKTFEVIFEDVLGNKNAFFTVVDGHLQSEYQSSLVSTIKQIKSFTKVHFQNVQYEKDEVHYQTQGFTIAIDSIVKPIDDECWAVFPIRNTFNQNISKTKILSLMQDSLGFNMCTKKLDWIDPNYTLEIYIAPLTRVNNQNVNAFMHVFSIAPKTNLDTISYVINRLRDGDLILCKPIVYQKNGAYYKTSEYRFKIEEQYDCFIELNLDSLKDSISLETIKSITTADVTKPTCLISSLNAQITSFKFIALAANSATPTLISVKGNQLNRTIVRQLKTLEKGDRIIIESITGITSHGTKVNLVPKVFTLK
jgi:hypothetical protein